MSASKRNKQVRFPKVKKEPESEERVFHVQRLNLDDARPSPIRKESKDRSKVVFRSGSLSSSSSSDSEYTPGKHAKSSLLAYKTQPEKKAKMAQAQLSSYFTPVKLIPSKDSLSQLSVFMTPVSDGSLGVKTPGQEPVIDISPNSTVSRGSKIAVSPLESQIKRSASLKTAKKSRNRDDTAEPEKERTENAEDQPFLFPDLKHQRGNLAYDRPVKIIGVRERQGAVEYAVLFSPSFGKCVDAAVYSQHELVSKAPWLFSNFILSDTTIS